MGASNSKIPKLKEKQLELYEKLTYLAKYEINEAYIKFDRMINDDENPEECKAIGCISLPVLKKHVLQLQNNPFTNRIFRVFTRHSEVTAEIPVAGEAHEGIYDEEQNQANLERIAAYNVANQDIQDDYDCRTNDMVFNMDDQITSNAPMAPITIDGMLPPKPTTKKAQILQDKQKIQKIKEMTEKSKMSFPDFVDMLSVFNKRTPDNVKAYYCFQIFDFSEDNNISLTDLQILIEYLTNIKSDKDLEDLDENQGSVWNQNQESYFGQGQDNFTYEINSVVAEREQTVRETGRSVHSSQRPNRETQITNARPTRKKSTKKEDFIRTVSKAILKEAATLHHRKPESGIEIQDFQKILLQNEEFRHNFSFSL